MTKRIVLDKGFFGTEVGEITDSGRLYLKRSDGTSTYYGDIEPDGIYAERGWGGREKVVDISSSGNLYLARDSGVYTHGTKIGSISEDGTVRDARDRRIGEVRGWHPPIGSPEEGGGGAGITVAMVAIVIIGIMFAGAGVVFYPALLGSSSVSATSKVGIIVTTAATILASVLVGALSSERTVKGLFCSIYPASWLVSTVVFVIYSIATDDLNGAGIFLLAIGGALLGLGWGFVAAGVSAVVFYIVRKVSSPGK